MTVLVLLLCPPAGDLNHPDFWARERCEHRLRDLGPLAWPSLCALRDHPDPEVRLRADRLLAPCRAVVLDARAWAALTGPRPHVPTLFGDEELRLRVYRLAEAAGVRRADLYYLDPAHDRYDWWSCGMPAQWFFARALDASRRHFRPAWCRW